MADRVLQRHDTSSNWSSVNPILAEGELGIVTDSKGYKIGDGQTNWNDLEYPSNPTIVANELGDSSSTAISQDITTKSILNTISLQDLDLDQDTISKLVFASIPSRYVVVNNKKNCGILNIFSDDSGHILTQILETHCIVEDGNITSSHSDNDVFIYKRSYHVIEGGTSDIPVGSWGKWEQMYSSEINNEIQILKSNVANLMSLQEKVEKLEQILSLQN